MFVSRYVDMFTRDERWRSLLIPSGAVFEWGEESTYVRRAPYFDRTSEEPISAEDIGGTRVPLKPRDSVTTDHAPSAGNIKSSSPAGAYLASQEMDRRDFSSHGSRCRNREAMTQGTFTNIQLRD